MEMENSQVLLSTMHRDKTGLERLEQGDDSEFNTVKTFFCHRVQEMDYPSIQDKEQRKR